MSAKARDKYSDFIDPNAGDIYAAFAGGAGNAPGTALGPAGDPLLAGDEYIVTFAAAEAVVPVPAAVWLFASALGLLGWVRRRVG